MVTWLLDRSVQQITKSGGPACINHATNKFSLSQVCRGLHALQIWPSTYIQPSSAAEQAQLDL